MTDDDGKEKEIEISAYEAHKKKLNSVDPLFEEGESFTDGKNRQASNEDKLEAEVKKYQRENKISNYNDAYHAFAAEYPEKVK